MPTPAIYKIEVCKKCRQAVHRFDGGTGKPHCPEHGVISDTWPEGTEIIEVVPRATAIQIVTYHCPLNIAAMVVRDIDRGGPSL